jgi:RimJ/RimL family protein N-acetyltransferase
MSQAGTGVVSRTFKPVPVLGAGFSIGCERLPMNGLVRRLGETDAEAYRSVRRRALIEHPEAYAATLEEFDSRSLDEIAASLAGPAALRCIFGAFVQQQLVGLAGYGRPDNAKLHHRAGLYQMYTAPEHRGRGLGRQLVDAVVAHARQEGVEELVLAVTVGNTAAETLYEHAGFAPKHVETRYIKLGSRYYDILWMSLMLHPVERQEETL